MVPPLLKFLVMLFTLKTNFAPGHFSQHMHVHNYHSSVNLDTLLLDGSYNMDVQVYKFIAGGFIFIAMFYNLVILPHLLCTSGI